MPRYTSVGTKGDFRVYPFEHFGDSLPIAPSESEVDILNPFRRFREELLSMFPVYKSDQSFHAVARMPKSRLAAGPESFMAYVTMPIKGCKDTSDHIDLRHRAFIPICDETLIKKRREMMNNEKAGNDVDAQTVLDLTPAKRPEADDAVDGEDHVSDDITPMKRAMTDDAAADGEDNVIDDNTPVQRAMIDDAADGEDHVIDGNTSAKRPKLGDQGEPNDLEQLKVQMPAN